MKSSQSPPILSQQIAQAHQRYCKLTGQKLRLDFGRERAWYELLGAGFDLEDLGHVINYLKGEIRNHRRNVGALKLSNLLQIDRFEEDFAISQVRLNTIQKPEPKKILKPKLSAQQIQKGRQRALEYLRQIKKNIQSHPSSTNRPESHEASKPSHFDNISTK